MKRQTISRRATTRRGKPAPRRVREGVCEVDYVNEVRASAALAKLPDDGTSLQAADGFGTLASPSRLRILAALGGQELCVCDLSQILGQSLSSTSQHLKALRSIGAVTFRADGRLAYYRIDDPFWAGLAGTLLKRVATRRELTADHRKAGG